MWSACVLIHLYSAKLKDYYNKSLRNIILILLYKMLCNLSKCLVNVYKVFC